MVSKYVTTYNKRTTSRSISALVVVVVVVVVLVLCPANLCCQHCTRWALLFGRAAAGLYHAPLFRLVFGRWTGACLPSSKAVFIDQMRKVSTIGGLNYTVQ